MNREKLPKVPERVLDDAVSEYKLQRFMGGIRNRLPYQVMPSEPRRKAKIPKQCRSCGGGCGGGYDGKPCRQQLTLEGFGKVCGK